MEKDQHAPKTIIRASLEESYILGGPTTQIELDALTEKIMNSTAHIASEQSESYNKGES